MPDDRIRRLVQHFDRARRENDAVRALDLLAKLERAQPRDVGWPLRAAEIHARAGNNRAEAAALRRAFELQIESKQTADAIATGTRILALEPDHAEIEDQLHALYLTTAAGASQLFEKPAAVLHSDPDTTDGGPWPVDEIVLTAIIPGTRPQNLGDSIRHGASAIPLDRRPPDLSVELHLDRLADEGVASNRPPRTARDPEADPVEDFLASLPRPEVDRLMHEGEIVRVAAGQLCVRQGERSTHMFVVLEGKVVPIVEGPGAGKGENAIELASLGAGAFFGEFALVTHQPRNASVRASEPTRLLAMDRTMARDLLRKYPELLSRVLRALRLRMVDHLIQTSPFFGCFRAARRSEVARQFQLVEVRDGTTIIQQGIGEQGVFVVLAGEVEVTQSGQDGERQLARLGHGQVLGEHSVLFEQPAIASVVARGRCWLFALSDARFRRILQDNPKLHQLLQGIGEHRARDNRRFYGRDRASEKRR